MMVNAVLVAIVCFSLALSLFIGIYALFRSQSSKRNYFLLMQTVIIIYLIGYLLEITSANAESAFTAVKVLYIGGFFLAPLAFFFVADFCDIEVPVFLRVPLLMLSLGSVLALWTNSSHGLVYLDYSFDALISDHLIFTPGPLYFLMRVYLLICIIMILATMLYKVKEWKNKYRKRLFFFFCCAFFPSLTEAVYFVSIVTGTNPYHINFTPHSVAIMSVFLYAGVVRFNIFEIIAAATVSAMQHIKEGFVLVDENNNYLSSNPAAAEIFPEIAVIPKGESVLCVKNWPKELANMKNYSLEFSIADEKCVRHFKASVSPVFNHHRGLLAKIILFNDITESVILMKKLENAACVDSLTGLYNRKHFTELATVGIKRAQRLNRSIYTGMLDLDFFKNINDTYGHAAGDMILKTTAMIICQTIRSYDLVGRYGGEEFSLFITDLEQPEILRLVERIRENIEAHEVIYEGLRIKFTCSIGLAKLLEDDTLETSQRKADSALYKAKNSGRNRVEVCDELKQGGAAQ